MKVFKLTREAKQDLRKIARYTEKRWGRRQRYLYVKQFDDVFYFLAETLTLGKKCDYIKMGYRKFPQGSHIVFYRENGQSKITIIRILHKKIDIESNLIHK